MAKVERVLFKVEGMLKRGGFVWMGWPDAIVSALERTEGIQKIVYLPEKEVFELWYMPSVISFKRIFEKIKATGEERNLNYVSIVLSIKRERRGHVVEFVE
jgi:hypothetical protein